MLRLIMWTQCLLLASFAVEAKTLTVDFELPSFETSDYHKPYVAIWVEGKQDKKTLLLWHLKRAKEDKWLVDIRRWWRKLGRYGDTPDAFTGATKGPGNYRETLDVGEMTDFKLFIEVVREDGGRSLLKQHINFNDSISRYQIQPDKEVGAVTIIKG